MNLDRPALEALASRYGDAFYLVDTAAFTRNCLELRDAFRAIYPRTRIAYSYKTNYLPALCRAAQSLGGYAEVVSPMEYELARRIGVPADAIIYNGPFKPLEALRRALLEGATVNLDGDRELGAVEQIVQGSPNCKPKVGLRCSFDIGESRASRFGFDASTDAPARALRRLRAIPGCRVEGIHCHFCTSTKQPGAFATIAARMVALAQELFPESGPRFVNIGGGFFSKMPDSLRAQFPCEVPSFEQYARAVAPEFARAFPGKEGPELILEPGVGVCADVMRFASRVVDVKSVGGRSVAVVTGSVYNVKPTKSRVNLPMHVIAGTRAASREQGPHVAGPFDVVGYTCMEDDCLVTGFDGSLAPGDWVVFDNVGAYTVVLKPPFIFPCPAIVEWPAPAGAGRVHRRAETFGDVFATYSVDEPPG